VQPNSPHYQHCLIALKNSPLFGQLSDDVLQDMLQIFHYETKDKNDTAISPQQASDRFYIVINGRAKVSVYNPDNGREHILFLIGPGDGFDLISLLDGKWHDAVATALDNMEVLFTTVEKAREWINQHPDFNRAFLPYLGQQMHTLANQVTDLSLYDTEARLARLVVRHLTPNSSPQKIELINDLSQETLASMIGSVRVVVTRHLQHWKQDNIVSGKRGSWTVKKLKTLLEKAESLL
jgi:CRP-like cAMP-binding protein